jgi:prephenate dehydratase
VTNPPVPRYGYLGPAGTFTEVALLNWLAGAPGELFAFGAVLSALDAVRDGTLAGAMVPVENSVEGSVTATLDALATGERLTIHAEAQVPVTFSLLARNGTRLRDVRRVTTHPHAEAQCRKWLASNLPDADFVAAASTASAAAVVGDGGDFDAAISAPQAPRVYRHEE